MVAILLVSAGPALAQYERVDVPNPAYYPNVRFPKQENLNSTRFAQIRAKYNLDAVVAGETDEFQRILLLRNWIRQTMPVCSPYMTSNDAFKLLDAAIAGGECFMCGQFMVVQNAILNAYGYVTRCMGSGPGFKDSIDWHHGVNEVWVNSLQKWVLTDAKHNSHFEKAGTPLSAIEVHDEYLRNEGADVTIMQGPSRTPVAPDATERNLYAFIWVGYESNCTRHTNYSSFDHEQLIAYADNYWNSNTWYRDGRPHWAYSANYFIKSTREQVEWTPNVVSVSAQIQGNSATANITSSTPNLKTYQMQVYPGGAWQAITNSVALTLTEPTHEWRFRAVNLVDVAGPEHRLVIALPGQIALRQIPGIGRTVLSIRTYDVRGRMADSFVDRNGSVNIWFTTPSQRNPVRAQRALLLGQE